MKIVIISSVVYPRVSPRSIRTTELAKELARLGHEVTVYALLGKTDYSDFETQNKLKVKNLGRSKLGNVNSDGEQNVPFLLRLFYKLFGTLLWLPDREYIPWVKRAISSEGAIDLLISIAVPHVIHYAVAKSDLLKVKKWIADCGDPFTLNPFFSYPNFYKKYELLWCEKCDVIAVPVDVAKDAYYPQFRDKIKVIPQGFDFANVELEVYKPNKTPTFCFAGVIHKDLRDPSRFLNYLSSLKEDFTFIFYTSSTAAVMKYKEKLGEKLIINEKIQRDELLKELSRMDFLVNIQNDSSVQTPSKLIDYALAKRPILNISSGFTEMEQVVFKEFMRGDYSQSIKVDNISQYDIKNVAKQFLE
jgi:hypothetical protein